MVVVLAGVAALLPLLLQHWMLRLKLAWGAAPREVWALGPPLPGARALLQQQA